MDGANFDRLTRLLANRPSRRQVVRGLSAALLGGAAVASITHEAAACIDVDSNQECKNDGDCCGDDVRCENQRCKCKSGFRQCRENGKEQCFDLKEDDNHCGNCNKSCRNGERCVNGKCGGKNNCTVTGLCGAGRPPCCAGLACQAGQPNQGLGGCVPA